MGALSLPARAYREHASLRVCWMLVRAASSEFGVSRRPSVLDALPTTSGRAAGRSQTPGDTLAKELHMSTSSTLERGNIYTLGYTQAKAEAHLERLMRNPRVLLVDVRYQP